MKYQSKRIFVDAVKWEKPGDHPAVKKVFGYWRPDADDDTPVFTPSHIDGDEPRGMLHDNRKLKLMGDKMTFVDPEELMDSVIAIQIGATWWHVEPGDYILSTPGGFDVCKAAEFEAAFEPAPS